MATRASCTTIRASTDTTGRRSSPRRTYLFAQRPPSCAPHAGRPWSEAPVRLPDSSADAAVGPTNSSHASRLGRAALVVALISGAHPSVALAGSRVPGADATGAMLPQQAARSGPARVVVTIVVEGLRIPAVDVELKKVDGNVVIAKTTSDVVGQVTFPDVSAGRYT